MNASLGILWEGVPFKKSLSLLGGSRELPQKM